MAQASGRPVNSTPSTKPASAVLMGVLLYGLFDYLLDIPLPRGVLLFLEG